MAKATKCRLHEDADLVLGPTTKGRWSYAASKALDEFLALSYWKEKSCPWSWRGCSTPWARGKPGDMAWCCPILCGRRSKARRSLCMDGQQSRCFCDVRDAVEAMLRLVSQRARQSVKSSTSATIRKSRSRASRIRGEESARKSTSSIDYIPYDQAYEPGFEDMHRRVPSLEKLQKFAGFRPRTSLVEIVDRVIDYFQKKSEMASTELDTSLSVSTSD